MKKVLKVALSIALVMGATSIYAQKFGRVNSQEIIMSMPETEEMRTNLEAFGKELEENIETINVEFNNKFQEYQKSANTLSESVREMKAKELEDLQRRSQEFQQRAQQDYAQKQQELLQPIIEKARAAIDKVAAAGGYLAVFDISAGSLAYFDEMALTDIAPEVRKELGITESAAAAAAATPAAAPASGTK
ncbi:OmpH family outer membrane protein [Alistipes sp.]|uniref:OmpH family outer membrane protein n=1 Tax=Alistipes sp. TaxID=1872444 RepID=UPI0025C09240|nr:OmpH family outer membrane protein [Alistipes sp.]